MIKVNDQDPTWYEKVQETRSKLSDKSQRSGSYLKVKIESYVSLSVSTMYSLKKSKNKKVNRRKSQRQGKPYPVKTNRNSVVPFHYTKVTARKTEEKSSTCKKFPAPTQGKHQTANILKLWNVLEVFVRFEILRGNIGILSLKAHSSQIFSSVSSRFFYETR